jgi:uncharacterized protein
MEAAMYKIVITAGDVTVSAELNESPTAQKVWEALPLQAEAHTWGDEIYFEVPVKMGQAPDAHAEVEVGTLGYWPMGHAFCIFFGPTPASTNGKPRAYSPVNIIGKVTNDTSTLRKVAHGTSVRVAKAKA